MPIPTDGRRSYYPLNYELSLNSVKQVEIIRGPGSVLWGPDAFAGIVNIVPLTGRDFDGAEIELAAGSSSTLKGFAGKGFQSESGKWDAYLSIYGAKNRYSNDSFIDIAYSEIDKEWRLMDARLDDSRYYEMTFNVNYNLDYKQNFSVSGRFSDFNKPYTLYTYYDAAAIAWPSEKKAPVNFLKLNYSKLSGRSHWNFTGYYQDVSYSQINADSSVEEEFGIFYAELLWDRRLFEKGLLTTGISYRKNHVEGALVGGGFIPELLLSAGGFFKQPIIQKDYENSLQSIFTQYRHPFFWGEFWAGFRLDDNSMYDSLASSYTMGLNIPLNSRWRVKTVFGTGYRTPYSQQLSTENYSYPAYSYPAAKDHVATTALTRDHVSTLNFQTEWSSGKGNYFSATAFFSRLSDNVQSDPYAGVSEPADHDFTGIELNYRMKINDSLESYITLSRILFSGDDYRFTVLTNSYLRPDGTTVDDFDIWTETYDPGADFTFSSGVLWHLHPKVDLSVSASWAAPVPYSYEENSITGEYSNPLMLNGEVRLKKLFAGKVKNLFAGDLMLTAGCKNILDGDFMYPGFYGPVTGMPLTVYCTLNYNF